MSKALYNQTSPLRKQYLNSSMDSVSFPKSFHVRNHYYPTSSSTDFEAKYKGGNYTLTSKDKSVPMVLNGFHEGNLNSNQELVRSNENYSSRGELEAVPERSIEYSEVTNKTSNLDSDVFKTRTEPDLEDRRYMNSYQIYTYEHLEGKNEPYLKTASFNLKSNSVDASEAGLSRSYISPKHTLRTDRSTGDGGREVGAKRNRERISRSSSKKHSRSTILLRDYNENGYMEYNRSNRGEREVRFKQTSPLRVANSRFRKSNPEGFGIKEIVVGRQSLPEFETRSLERSEDKGSSRRNNKVKRKSQLTRDSIATAQDQMEIVKLKERNEKLEGRIKNRERRLEELNKVYEDAYSKYIKAKGELEELRRRESEVHQSQRDRSLQLEDKERALLLENEALRHDDSRKNKIIGDLESQINRLKSDIFVTNNKHTSQVEALKLQIKKLEEENSNLMHQRRRINEEKSYYQRLEVSIEEENMSLQRELEESQTHIKKLSDINEELIQKLESIKKTSQDKEKTYRERLDESNLESKKLLEESLHQVKEDTSRYYHGKLNVYKSKIEELIKENDNLKLELQSRPTLRKFKENEAKLFSLENELEEAKHTVIEHRKKISEINMPSKVMRDITNELEVNTIGEIVPKIKEVMHDHKISSKFTNSMLDLVHNCTPKGYFDGKPTPKQAWKWIKTILEEYMNIKRHEGQILGTGTEKEILKIAMDFLRVKDKEEVPHKVRQVMISNSLMSQIIAKVKEIHNLEWVESLPELERRLDAEKSSKPEEHRYKSANYR